MCGVGVVGDEDLVDLLFNEFMAFLLYNTRAPRCQWECQVRSSGRETLEP